MKNFSFVSCGNRSHWDFRLKAFGHTLNIFKPKRGYVGKGYWYIESKTEVGDIHYFGRK